MARSDRSLGQALVARHTHRVAPPPLIARDATELRQGLAVLWPELRRRARRLSGNHAAAEDLAQEAVERALRFAAQYDRGTNLRAWAFQILFNVFVTRWRGRRREQRALARLSADPHAWTAPRPWSAPDRGESGLLASTRRKLEALPPGFRQAILLVDLGTLSYRDAARALGVPVGTVMSRLHRGRKLLASQLTDDEQQAA